MCYLEGCWNVKKKKISTKFTCILDKRFHTLQSRVL